MPWEKAAEPIPLSASLYPLPEGMHPQHLYFRTANVTIDDEELTGLGLTKSELKATLKNSCLTALTEYPHVASVTLLEEKSPPDGQLVVDAEIEHIIFRGVEVDENNSWSEKLSFLSSKQHSAANVTANIRLSEIADGEERLLGSRRAIGRYKLSSGWQETEIAVDGEEGAKKTEIVMTPVDSKDVPTAITLGIQGSVVQLLTHLESAPADDRSQRVKPAVIEAGSERMKK